MLGGCGEANAPAPSTRLLGDGGPHRRHPVARLGPPLPGRPRLSSGKPHGATANAASVAVVVVATCSVVQVAAFALSVADVRFVRLLERPMLLGIVAFPVGALRRKSVASK